MLSTSDWITPPTREGFTPTPEQAAIVDAVKSSNDNLLVSALAGAAKTSTLVLIADALPTTAMLCLAFNKRIAVEMSKRLPGTCVAKTLNSLGHTAWARYLNKKFLTVDEKKTYRIVRSIIEGIKNEAEKREAYGKMADLMRAVDFGKTCGYIPNGRFPAFARLMGDDDFFAHLEEEPSVAEMEIIQAATLISLEEAHQGVIDFNDQILCATLSPASFTQYPITLVDEAQDLSALNHFMLKKIVGRKRLIAVGDECQSIYGFRGAHEDSMRLLQQDFSMRELVLSVSFRCPVKIIEEARWRAPHMRWPEWAKPGEVRTLTGWTANDIPEDTTIICRNNAPLFGMAIRLLRNGRYPELVGADIGKTLLKVLRGLGKADMATDEVLEAITTWRDERLRKSRNRDKIYDQAACLEIFAKQGKTLGDAIAYAEHILSVAGPIKLMTGHKSKGLEFENIFFLDQDLLGDDPQDRNLRYVIQTRAKSTLTYVQSSGFEDTK